MTAPWTPRERALYKALEASHLWWRHDLSCQDGLKAQCKCQSCIDKWVAGLLADPPPPDPRDEALRQITEIGGNLPDERLTTATGPRDAAARGLMYVRARAIALAAIRATKGER